MRRPPFWHADGETTTFWHATVRRPPFWHAGGEITTFWHASGGAPGGQRFAQRRGRANHARPEEDEALVLESNQLPVPDGPIYQG